MQELFHPSGKPSLRALRDMLSLMPGAVTICDADTSENIAMSPAAMHLFRVNSDNLLRGKDFRLSAADWDKEVAYLASQMGTPVRVAATLKNSLGEPFSAVGSIVLMEMVGRRVIIASIEPALPLSPENTPESIASLIQSS